MQNKYVVRIDGQRGTEEYDGGTTLAQAREEAAFFVANTPAHVGVRICALRYRDLKAQELGAYLVEVAR